MTDPVRPRPAALFLAALAVGWLTGCSGASPVDPAPGPGTPTANSPTSGAPTGASTTAAPVGTPTVTEPTTTNTLPPPPVATRPAPSTAGDLTAGALPRPAGWSTVARPGGSEEGFEGNGTWVHAKDARYAAQDLITIGCAPVTRDDYPDPTRALEGNYDRDGAPGVGLALQFADAADASAFFARYQAQVQACDDPDVVRATVIGSELGLIDRRAYPDGEWTEVARQRGDRLVFVILSGRLSESAAEAILRQIR